MQYGQVHLFQKYICIFSDFNSYVGNSVECVTVFCHKTEKPFNSLHCYLSVRSSVCGCSYNHLSHKKYSVVQVLQSIVIVFQVHAAWDQSSG